VLLTFYLIIDYLRTIFKETIEEMGGILEEFDGELDHVHLLIQYPPKWSISKSETIY